ALFYTYVSGEDRLLKQTMDQLLQTRGQFTEQLCEQLFQTHIATMDEERLKNLQGDMIKVLDYIHQSLVATGNDTSQFEKSFSSHREKLLSDVDVVTIREIVETLVSDTQAMQAVGHRLRENLEEGSDEISRLREQLNEAKRDALTDPLTGLPNRRAFDSHLNNLIKEQTSCSLLILDIDHFKHFNDEYGHLLGDKVLRHVANSTQSCIKGRDFVARFGGEEFAILLAETPLGGAARVGEEIRKTIEKTRLVKKESHEPIGPVTISIGVAQYHAPETLEMLIERADKALYRSKNKGRNRVTQETEL
ncbi:MAG: GGDEF domain-containing protein, partial [Thioalkalispiraceae bacterium]